MNKEDVYKHFVLEAQVWEAVINWLRKVTQNSSYKNTPYKILNIALIDGGCLGVKVLFLTDEETIGVEEYYRINIKDLEEC